jgi:hypothetical protein
MQRPVSDFRNGCSWLLVTLATVLSDPRGRAKVASSRISFSNLIAWESGTTKGCESDGSMSRFRCCVGGFVVSVLAVRRRLRKRVSGKDGPVELVCGLGKITTPKISFEIGLDRKTS